MMMPQMTAILDQVIEVLEQSEALFQELVPIFDRERRAGLRSKPHELVEVTIEKEELLARLRKLERKRIDLINLMAKNLKLSPTQLNLSALAARADAQRASRILNLRDSLGRLVKTIKRANNENRLLFQHCLDLARGALGFFQHWMMPASVYGSSGRIDNGHRNGKLLSGTI
jgi:flagellar biosynthesis/type III secretory pathway chaperone